MVARTRRRTPLFIAVVLASLVAPALTAGVQPAWSASKKSSYKKCKLPERERFPRGGKPTYNTSLKTVRSSCRTARRVMKAFHKCRSTKSYRCSKRVLRKWRCRGRRTSRIATMFNGTYTCTWGKRRVRGMYQQNT